MCLVQQLNDILKGVDQIPLFIPSFSLFHHHPLTNLANHFAGHLFCFLCQIFEKKLERLLMLSYESISLKKDLFFFSLL